MKLDVGKIDCLRSVVVCISISIFFSYFYCLLCFFFFSCSPWLSFETKAILLYWKTNWKKNIWFMLEPIARTNERTKWKMKKKTKSAFPRFSYNYLTTIEQYWSAHSSFQSKWLNYAVNIYNIHIYWISIRFNWLFWGKPFSSCNC